MQISKLFLGLLVAVGFCNQGCAMDDLADATGLYQAIVDGNLEQVQECIQKIEDFNPNDKYNANGYREDEKFTSAKAPSAAGKACDRTKQFSPLYLACEYNQLKIVRLLVDKYGAAVNNERVFNAITNEACATGDSRLLRYLLSRGLKPSQEKIKLGLKWLQHTKNQNDPTYKNVELCMFYLQGGKAIAGIPMTRMNMGIIAVVCVAGLAAGKYFYDRYRAKHKKSQTDADEADEVDAQRELNTELI
jgi:Ankyrin repeat